MTLDIHLLSWDRQYFHGYFSVTRLHFLLRLSYTLRSSFNICSLLLWFLSDLVVHACPSAHSSNT